MPVWTRVKGQSWAIVVAGDETALRETWKVGVRVGEGGNEGHRPKTCQHFARVKTCDAKSFRMHRYHSAGRIALHCAWLQSYNRLGPSKSLVRPSVAVRNGSQSQGQKSNRACACFWDGTSTLHYPVQLYFHFRPRSRCMHVLQADCIIHIGAQSIHGTLL